MVVRMPAVLPCSSRSSPMKKLAVDGQAEAERDLLPRQGEEHVSWERCYATLRVDVVEHGLEF